MKLLLIGKNTSCDLEEDALTLLLKSQVPSLSNGSFIKLPVTAKWLNCMKTKWLFKKKNKF